MTLNTMKRHVREGSKNIWRNGWMTVASVGAVTTTLVLVGIFLALMLNLNHVATNLEEDVHIKALIELTAEEEEIEQIKSEIEDMAEVETIEFSTKDQELESLIADMGEEGKVWEMYQQDNPLNHAYIVKTEDPQDTELVASKIESIENIYEVEYGKDVVENLFQFNSYARSIGIVLIIGLIFTAIFLISNTIKITIMARKKEIGIMKLVGATNGFIRWPFFVEGLLLGVLGSIIPILIVIFGYFYIEKFVNFGQQFYFIELLPFNQLAWQLSLIILAIGAGIGVWGSVMSVRKFLKV